MSRVAMVITPEKLMLLDTRNLTASCGWFALEPQYCWLLALGSESPGRSTLLPPFLGWETHFSTQLRPDTGAMLN